MGASPEIGLVKGKKQGGLRVMKDISEGLGKTFPFSILNRKEIDLVAGEATKLQLSEGKSLFQPGSPNDALHVVIAGGIKLFRINPSSSRLILNFFGPGELVVEDGILKDIAHNSEARPVGKAQVIKIGFKVLQKLLESNTKFSQACLDMLANQISGYRERLELLVFKDVEARLALALINLADKFGKKEQKGTLINIKITHQDISDYIAASRETVSLCLGQFRRKRLIATEGRQLIIPDLKTLRKIAAT